MTYDAIVVGARIAGATTALLLAQKGYSVLLLDQDRFPSSTLSTHLFFTDTMQVFERVGVLDEVLAVDAPRLQRLKFPYVDAPFPERDGRDFALCIRREVLDQILVSAASAEQRIDLRTSTRVIGLVRDGERVVGVRFRPVGGSEETNATARIVIGADGRNSFIAREVGADSYNDVPVLFAWYYAYFPNVPLDEPPSAMAERLAGYQEVGAEYGASFVFPTDGDLTLVGFGVQRSAFDAF
ncbi:MAG: NAD(P)/FAD-dependent oxidoreductase, partial [Nitrolancea sp.]